jgi:hypothetical protein
MSYEMTMRALEQTGLKSSTKSVLNVICIRANEKKQCWPSTARLIKDTALNRKTVLAAIQTLIDLKLIKKTGEFKGKTKSVPVYEVLIEDVPKTVPLKIKDDEAVPNLPPSCPKNGMPKLSQKRDIEYKERIEKEYKSFFSDYLAYASQKRSDIRLGLTKDDVMEFWQWIEKNFKLAG